MKFGYKTIYKADNSESISTIDTDSIDFRDMIGSLNGIYVDYKNSDFSNEDHLIYDLNVTDESNVSDIDESDFAKIGEAVKQRPDFAEILKYLAEEFGGNYYYKQFMYDFFREEV